MKHLVTPRLLMRPFAPGDLTDLHTLYSDPQVMKHINGGNPRTPEETSRSLENMIKNFEQNDYGMFALIERKEKRFIGRCGLQPLENTGLIELGYTLVPSAWGKGYATEAAMEVLRASFTDWGLQRVVAISKEENRPSTRVMEKVGMIYAGRDRFYGKDVVLYALEAKRREMEASFQSNSRHSSRLSMPAL